MKDEISIYIPVFNGEKTIKACLESVFEQTLKPKQILVINDNSNDGTLEILKSFREKIEIISNSSNKGVSFSRNLAVNHLKTRYIASIDADVVLSKKLDRTNNQFFKKNSATLVGEDCMKNLLKILSISGDQLDLGNIGGMITY